MPPDFIPAVHNPDKGRFTFDLEGQEGGPWHSRHLHNPSPNSGVTIGRGYDMRDRPPIEIFTDLSNAGVDRETATALSQASGLRGEESMKKFVADNKLQNYEMSSLQQKKLFDIAYGKSEEDVRRIARKKDFRAAYGECDFDSLPEEMRDVLIDMRYVGHYNPKTRPVIQAAANSGDLAKFRAALIKADSLIGPGHKSRHAARIRHIEKAIMLRRNLQKKVEMELYPRRMAQNQFTFRPGNS